MYGLERLKIGHVHPIANEAGIKSQSHWRMMTMMTNKRRQDLLDELEYLIETDGSRVRIDAIRRHLMHDNKIRKQVKNGHSKTI